MFCSTFSPTVLVKIVLVMYIFCTSLLVSFRPPRKCTDCDFINLGMYTAVKAVSNLAHRVNTKYKCACFVLGKCLGSSVIIDRTKRFLGLLVSSPVHLTRA